MFFIISIKYNVHIFFIPANYLIINLSIKHR